MATFIELTSLTSSSMRWLVNVDSIVMVRRAGTEDDCQVSLKNGGTITPAETYTEVSALLKVKSGGFA